MKTGICSLVFATGALSTATIARTTGGEDLCAIRLAPTTSQKEVIQSEPRSDRKQGTAPVSSKDAGDKTTAMNRILLVDLGERELKKREELKKRNSRGSIGTPMPECGERIEVKP